MPDGRSILLHVEDYDFLQALFEKQHQLLINGQPLVPEDLNSNRTTNIITIMVLGLPCLDVPGVQEIAKQLAVQIEAGSGQTSLPPGFRVKVTDIYGEFTKLIFDEHPRFVGALRAAVRLFPNPTVSSYLPGFFRYNDFVFPLEYRGRLEHCNKCKDRNNGKPHLKDQCPQDRRRKRCRVCGSTDHLQKDCPQNPGAPTNNNPLLTSENGPGSSTAPPSEFSSTPPTNPEEPTHDPHVQAQRTRSGVRAVTAQDPHALPTRESKRRNTEKRP